MTREWAVVCLFALGIVVLIFTGALVLEYLLDLAGLAPVE